MRTLPLGPSVERGHPKCEGVPTRVCVCVCLGVGGGGGGMRTLPLRPSWNSLWGRIV